MPQFDTGWLTGTSGFNVSGALPNNTFAWGLPFVVVTSSNNASVAQPMSAQASGTNWVVGIGYGLLSAIKAQVTAYTGISARGFEVQYTNFTQDQNQFNQKVCGLSIVTKVHGVTNPSAIFHGDRGWNVCAAFPIFGAQVTGGGPTQMWGMTPADVSGGFWDDDNLGFAVRINVSGTGGITGNPVLNTFQLRFYYDYAYPVPVNAEFDWEEDSPTLGFTNPSPAEFDFEAKSVLLGTNFIVQSEEYGFEAGSISLVPGLNIQSVEFGWEAGSQALVDNIVPNAAEFGWEVSTIHIISGTMPGSAEFGWEAKSAYGLKMPLQIKSAEFDSKIKSAALALHQSIDVRSAEFTEEFTNARVLAGGTPPPPGRTSIVAQSIRVHYKGTRNRIRNVLS